MAKRSTPAATAANPDPFGTIPGPDEQEAPVGGANLTATAPAEASGGDEPPKAEAVEGVEVAEGHDEPVPPEDPAVVQEREKQQRREALAQIAAEYEPLFETVRARKRAARAREELIEAKQRAETEYNRQFVELDDIAQAAGRVEGSTWDARARLLKEYAELAGELRALGEKVDPLEQ